MEMKDDDEPERCPRSATCALVPDHSGSCDPRSERERFDALYRLLDAGCPDGELERRMEEGAVAYSLALDGNRHERRRAAALARRAR
jgi:hypothetical protein